MVREMEGLAAAGVPISVLAIHPGAGAQSGADATGRGLGGSDRFPVHYLSRRRSATGVASPARPAGAARLRLLAALAGDMSHLRLHPRRAARAARLAACALRGAPLIPAGTVRLHAHFANDAAALARYLSRLTDVPFTVTAHAWDIYQDPFLLGRNLAAAERVYTVSRVNARLLEGLARGGGWDPSRVAVLRCGVDLTRFAYRDPPPVRAPPRLICVARLVEKKGHDDLVEALSRLRRQGVDASLTVVGDGPLATRLRDRVAACGLADHVRLLGAVPPQRALEEILASDLMVLAARVASDGDRDGLPVSIVEAMALGVPVVSTDVSGIPELVGPSTGRLAPAADPDALAAAIRAALAEDQAERVGRTRSARRAVEAGFDLRFQVEALRPR